ncbi:MAG: DUF882 domain-containing protein [Hyphomicrobium sp.]|nr:DUF882 domain-containing protein [Hyphomicrobium sp.]
MMTRSKTGMGVARCIAMAAFAAVASLLAVASVSTLAHAETVPFWEQADFDKAAAKKLRTSKAAAYGSKKRYAASGKSKSAANRKKLGGYAEATETKKRKSRGVRVAALGNTYYSEPAPAKSLTGGSVRWVASSGCLDSGIKAVLYQVAANFGPLTVNSTCRAKGHNRAVGGAKKSKHLTGDAADFRVRGNAGAVYAFLKSSGSVGGLKHYGGGLFHIDNGERRSW